MRTGQKVHSATGMGPGRPLGRMGQTVHSMVGVGPGRPLGRMGQTVHVRGPIGCFIAEVTGRHYYWWTGVGEPPWIEDDPHTTLEFCLGTSLEPVGVGHLAVAISETDTIFDFGTIQPWTSEWPFPGDAPWQSVSDENNQMSLRSIVYHLTGETALLTGNGQEEVPTGTHSWDIVQRGVTAVPHDVGAEVRVSDNDTLGSIEDGGTTLTVPVSGVFNVRWYGYLYDYGPHQVIENGISPDNLGPRFDLRLNGVTIDSAYDEWVGGEALYAQVIRDVSDVALTVGDELQVWAYGDNAPNEVVYLTSSCSILIDGCDFIQQPS